MPTYAQLRTEWYWDAERTSPAMNWLIDTLSRDLGIPRARFGNKGDNASGHMRGSHRSQRWILNSRFCTNRTYTVAPGLPDALQDFVVGLDITPMSREQMLVLCRRIDVATRAGQLECLTEWYGNTNNDERVDGWNNIENRVASSDPSHLWHWHGTLDRWLADDMNSMRRIHNVFTGRPIGSAPPPPAPTQKRGNMFSVWYKRVNNDVTWAVERPALRLTDPAMGWEVVSGDIQDELAKSYNTVNIELPADVFDARAALYQQKGK
jgi:hypothetical protein